MATRDDVLDAIHRIETAGGAGAATRAAQASLTLPLPPEGYDRLLQRLVPSEQQDGRAAQAMRAIESALAQQLSRAAEFDRQIIEALRHVHQTTLEGRRRLADLQGEIAGAAQAWDLSTAAGAREFQRFLIVKLGEVIRLVEDANDDDTSKHALATALTALYLAQSDPDGPAPVERTPETDDAPAPVSADPSSDEDSSFEPLLDTDAQADYGSVSQRPPEAPSMPAVPGLGGEGPGFGAMPAGFPPVALPSGSDPGDAAADQEVMPDDAGPPEDFGADSAEGDKLDDDTTAETPPDDGPVTVTLPDGATTTVVDRRLGAAMQAAAEGTPVAEAFRRQGIDIPPPGTPVTAPVDRADLRPGDIGVFTDRHALAVGEGKALLDGQIHLTDNLRGPGFLGWQHPHIEQSPAAGEPAATRPAAAFPGPASLKIHVPTVIVD